MIENNSRRASAQPIGLNIDRKRRERKPAGVLLSPADYDELTYRKSFLDSVARGLEDAESSRTEVVAVFETGV